ncbi:MULTISPECIES: recombinase family protein [unclassified Streptomyces]|uniref:recombinase family protein n=1 Tax=unclassified Streptomyces TaxID=2593676 RepID=UPI00386D2287|nr:recombinase family protein [Streptomyces sp. NBC_00827]
MVTGTATMIGREILRVSQDKSGIERSNEEQHAENAGALAEYRTPITLVGEPYRDVGSASDYAKKTRDGFGQLIADLQSGEFGADVLVMWENSRAPRQPREWIAVAGACRARGILVFITTAPQPVVRSPQRRRLRRPDRREREGDARLGPDQ